MTLILNVGRRATFGNDDDVIVGRRATFGHDDDVIVPLKAQTLGLRIVLNDP